MTSQRVEIVNDGSAAGAVNYKGTWNPATNVPHLGNSGSGGVQGDYYTCSVDGTTSIDGISTWYSGDKIVNNGTKWEKIEGQGDDVRSFNGRTGDVHPAVSDYDASQIDNDSSVTGTTVKDALETLNAKPSGGVSKFNNRTGDVVPQAGDYNATEISTNQTGHTVQDELTDRLKRIAGDFNSFTQKAPAVSNDILLLEDSADSYNKKKVKISDLPFGSPTINQTDLYYVDGQYGNNATADGTIGKPFQTIQACLTWLGQPLNATDFQRRICINISTGNYTENLVVPMRGITLSGRGVQIIGTITMEVSNAHKWGIGQSTFRGTLTLQGQVDSRYTHNRVKQGVWVSGAVRYMVLTRGITSITGHNSNLVDILTATDYQIDVGTYFKVTGTVGYNYTYIITAKIGTNNFTAQMVSGNHGLTTTETVGNIFECDSLGSTQATLDFVAINAYLIGAVSMDDGVINGGAPSCAFGTVISTWGSRFVSTITSAGANLFQCYETEFDGAISVYNISDLYKCQIAGNLTVTTLSRAFAYYGLTLVQFSNAITFTVNSAAQTLWADAYTLTSLIAAPVTWAVNTPTIGYNTGSNGVKNQSVVAGTTVTDALNTLSGGSNRTTFNNTDYVGLSTDRIISQIGTLSAPRTVQLPLASSVAAGWNIFVLDESGTVNKTNSITVSKKSSGSDLVNDGTAVTIEDPYGIRRFISNGTNKWTYEALITNTIINSSTVSGATAEDALNTLQTTKVSVISANTTLTVKATGGDFTTLQAALDSLNHKWIDEAAIVTIAVDTGTFTSASTVTITHPQANRINIVGNNNIALNTTTITSFVSSSGSAGNWSVILGVADVTGLAINGFVQLTAATGTGEFASIQGIWQITNVDVGNSQITVTHSYRKATFPTMTLTGGTVVIHTTVLQFNGCDGFQTGSNLGLMNNLVIRGSGSGAWDGVNINQRNTVYAQGPVRLCGGAPTYLGITYFGRNGINHTGMVDLYTSATAVSFCGGFGFCVLQGAKIQGTNNVASGNGDDGVNLSASFAILATLVSCGNGGNGLRAYNGTKATISQCVAHGNANSGFFVAVGSAVYSASTMVALNNTWCGVYATTGAAVYVGSTLTASGNGATSGNYGLFAYQKSVIEAVTIDSQSNTYGDVYAANDGLVRANSYTGTPVMTPTRNLVGNFNSLIRDLVGTDITGYILSNTNITVKTSGGDFTTLQAAIDSLRDKWIDPGVSVTITIDPGIWTHTSTITINNPNSDRIFINGATPITSTITSFVGVSGAAGNYSLSLGVSSTTGMVAGQYLMVKTAVGTPVINTQVIPGMWLISSIDSPTQVTVINTCRYATFPTISTLTSGNLVFLPTTMLFNGCGGFLPYTQLNLDAMAIVGNNAAGCIGISTAYAIQAPSKNAIVTLGRSFNSVGISTFGYAGLNVIQGNISISSYTIVSNCGGTTGLGVAVVGSTATLMGPLLIITGCAIGMTVLSGASTYTQNLLVTGNLLGGVNADLGASVYAQTSNFTYNVTFGVHARSSVIWLANSNVQYNTTYGVHAEFGGTCIANSNSALNNTLFDYYAVNGGIINAIGYNGSPTISPAKNTLGNFGALVRTDTTSSDLSGLIIANTTYTVKTSGGDFTTLALALAFLADKWIDPSVTVTINVDPGSWVSASTININHLQGDRILIRGAAPVNTTITSFVGVSGSAGAWNIQLGVTDTTGMTANQYLLVKTAVGTVVPNPSALLGIWKIVSVDSPTQLTLLNTFKGAAFPTISTLTSGNVSCLTTVFQFNGATGFTINGGVLNIDQAAVVGNNAGTSAGVKVNGFLNQNNKSTFQAGVNTGISNFDYAGLLIVGGSAFCSYISICTCGGSANSALYIEGNGFAKMPNSILNGNRNGAYCYANGVAYLNASTIVGNTVYALTTETGGAVYAGSAGVFAYNGSHGVYAQPGGNIWTGNSKISFSGGHGIYANGGRIYADIGFVDSSTNHNYFAQSGGMISCVGSTSTNPGATYFDYFASNNGVIDATSYIGSPLFSPSANVTGNSGGIIKTATSNADVVSFTSFPQTLLSTHNLVELNVATPGVVNLPAASTVKFKRYSLANLGAGAATVTPNGAETIGGTSTLVINQNCSYDILSDGTNWIITSIPGASKVITNVSGFGNHILTTSETNAQLALQKLDTNTVQAYTSSSSPGINNDGVDTAALGKKFKRGDIWINTTNSQYFVCLNNATGAAVWKDDQDRIGIALNGSGNVLTLGSKGYTKMGYSGYFTGWEVWSDNGTSIFSVDVKKGTFGSLPTTSSIAGTELPSLATQQGNSNYTIASWSPNFNQDDWIEFVVNRASVLTKVWVFLTTKRYP